MAQKQGKARAGRRWTCPLNASQAPAIDPWALGRVWVAQRWFLPRRLTPARQCAVSILSLWGAKAVRTGPAFQAKANLVHISDPTWKRRTEARTGSAGGVPRFGNDSGACGANLPRTPVRRDRVIAPR